MSTRRTALRLAATVVVGLITLAGEAVWSQDQRGGRRLSTVLVEGREAVEGEVLVKYRANMGPIERVRAEFQVDADEDQAIGRRGARRMRSRGLRTRDMLAILRANPDIEFVEPNYVIRLNTLPNDPHMFFLWGLFNTGQNINGSVGIAGADITANLAWDYTTGSRANVVGVIDTGIDYNHPDLAANIWSAPTPFTVTIGGVPITCAAGTHGFNAINRTCDPMDDQYHGTHVAGTIGAVGHNSTGVAGVNWVASMMGLKFLNAAGSGFTSDAIDAIEFAIQAKAFFGAQANVRVLNNSWGGGGFSQALKNQIDAAYNAEMLFVAAAGNGGPDNIGDNNDAAPHYPSSYTSLNVVSVASTTNRDQRSSFSNYGATSVDLGAPGSSIVSTFPGGGYVYLSGTSMATPHVAGAAALLLAECPMATDMLKTALLASTDPISAMSGVTSTGGRLNVGAAMQACFSSAVTLNATVSGNTISVDVANGPARRRDWVALFCPASNGDASYTAWKYLNNTTTEPSSGLQSATVTFSGPAVPATCNARFFFNGGGLKLATSNTVTFAPIPPAMTLNTPSVNPGGTISVTLANGPANPTDWAALFVSGAAHLSHMQWRYLNGTQTAPAVGLSSATLQFTAPQTPGTYEVRWFSNNSAIRLATSPGISVVAVPSLSVSDVSVTEGNAGTAIATFTVTLSPANLSQTVTVDYATANGTAATAGGDYAATAGTLTFAPAATTRTFTVAINGDTAGEANETFVVNLSNAVNAAIGDGQGIGTITNDDVMAPPSLAVNTPAVSPGGTIGFSVAGGPANPTDWVALVPAAGADSAYIQWQYLNGQQTAPSAGTSDATLQIAAPLATGTYNIRLFANNQLTKLATSPTITVGLGPTLTIGDASVTEGNSGSTTATFTVTLAPVNLSQTVTVDFATGNGTATTADNDYGATNGTLTFDPAVATRTISVTVNGDTAVEPNEIFVVNLSNATNTVIGSSQAVGTILSDDTPPGPAVTITTPNVAPGGVLQFAVAGGPANRMDWVTVTPASSPDNAYLDWVYLNGQKTAPATGLSSATLQFVAPSTPGLYNVRLFANNALTRLASSNSATVATGPTLSVNDPIVTEGNSGTTVLTFTVSLSPVTASQTVTVDYETADLTATAASGDYVATSGTLSFSPSEATQTFSVTVNGDTGIEGNESLVVNLTHPVNAVLGDAQGVGVIVNDDVAPGPTVTVGAATVAPGGAISVSVASGPANRMDWVAVVPASAADNAYLDWRYLNGTKTAPASGASSAAVQLTAPLTPGTYNVRFYANNSSAQKLATSSTFSVQ